MPEGRFITFAGGEGVGKSTQIRRLDEALRGRGLETVLTREPGGSPGAEEIRKLLVTGPAERWIPQSELLLLYAARLDHVERTIKPALRAGKWVLCDRFSDSPFAYQGYGHEIGPEIILDLHRLVMGTFHPDLTILLDLDVEEGLRRAHARHAAEAGRPADVEDRFERMDIAFHARMRKGFQQMARRNKERSVIVDASGDVDGVFGLVLEAVERRFFP